MSRASIRFLAALGLAGLLSACGASGGGAVKTASARPVPTKTVVRAPVPRAPQPARIMTAPGLEGVIGASAADLSRQFGPARLDVLEGDARKLQWTGTACVLDVFLYPQQAGADPRATYAEARRASDGQEVDRAACVAAMRRK